VYDDVWHCIVLHGNPAFFMMQENRLWLLMARRLSNEITPAELDELWDLLEESPDKEYLLNILHAYFTASPESSTGQGSTGDGLEERFIKMMSAPAANHPDPIASRVIPLSFRKIASFRKAAAYAAAIAAVVLLGWGIIHLFPDAPGTRKMHEEEFLSRAGTRTKLVLPDGTQVWLNSNSKLKYTSEFNANAREVSLEGEAYFDVVKDVLHPFIVHTSSLDIKVLGTAFTIKSYPQDETVEATLLRGTIEVSRKDNSGTPRVILKPNEKLVFNKKKAVLARPGHSRDQVPIDAHPATLDMAVNRIRQDIPDSNKVETAWIYNRLVFNGDTFRELAEKMERWYNVRITIKDESLNSYRFGGAFAKETVEQAFKALQLTTDFRYKISGNEIELYAKE
jgi:transmembrane sensor